MDFQTLKRFYEMDEADLERIKRIEERLDALERIIKIIEPPTTRKPSPSLSMKALLALSGSLQKTMLAIQELEEATSTGVAEKTGRARSVETIYLNQLTRLGYLNKERRGRKIYFTVLEYY